MEGNIALTVTARELAVKRNRRDTGGEAQFEGTLLAGCLVIPDGFYDDIGDFHTGHRGVFRDLGADGFVIVKNSLGNILVNESPVFGEVEMFHFLVEMFQYFVLKSIV